MLKELIAELKGKIGEGMLVQAIEFEKDDPTNFHIDFIHACAQLRARNYRIRECDHGKTKMIAGRIIPAIATTTAMITGAVAVEFYKFVQGWTDLAKFKSFMINLALPFWLVTEPDEVIRTKDDDINGKAVPEGWTVYDRIVINEGSMTVQQLFDWFEKNMNLEVDSVFTIDNPPKNIYIGIPSMQKRLG